MFSDIHTEEELLREIEQEDEWFESLDLNSFEEEIFEDIDEDEIILYEDEDEEDIWVH